MYFCSISINFVDNIMCCILQADLKMDAPIYKKSVMALRCFKRAVEIDDSNVKLWIEYGTLAYQLHSHASRQLKWVCGLIFGQLTLYLSCALKDVLLIE